MMIAPRSARSGWRRRPLLSASFRVAATLVPVIVSMGVAFALNRMLPTASDTTTSVGRSLLLAVCSLAALVVTDKLARRFLPLAVLLQLSLIFPDQTPSRFKAALKGGSGRRLAREVDLARHDGISDDPTRAAEQLLMLATAMGDHDRRTRGHSERVRLYTDLIAEELGMSDDERSRLQWAALIHDIGKIEVPQEILNKKGRPDAKEWAILQTHPLVGERLASPVEAWLGDAVHAVVGHHERWDGTGYPRGLKGPAIPRAAAIVAVADAFEVMTAVRSYKQSMPLADARAELTRCAGTHFSPDVVRALLSVSIGRLRRSMGVLAGLAHLPFVGQAAKAAAYAPDSVATAVGFTTSTAAAGVGVVAVSGALSVASTPPARTDAGPVNLSSRTSLEMLDHLHATQVPSTSRSQPDVVVAVADIEMANETTAVASIVEPPPTTMTTLAEPTPDTTVVVGDAPPAADGVVQPPPEAPPTETDADDQSDDNDDDQDEHGARSDDKSENRGKSSGNSGSGSSGSSGSSGNSGSGSSGSGSGGSGSGGSGGSSGSGNGGHSGQSGKSDDD